MLLVSSFSRTKIQKFILEHTRTRSYLFFVIVLFFYTIPLSLCYRKLHRISVLFRKIKTLYHCVILPVSGSSPLSNVVAVPFSFLERWLNQPRKMTKRGVTKVAHKTHYTRRASPNFVNISGNKYARRACNEGETGWNCFHETWNIVGFDRIILSRCLITNFNNSIVDGK